MKQKCCFRFVFILLLCAPFLNGMAQDEIYLQNDTKNAKVTEITPEFIKFNSAADPSNVFTISRKKVVLIFNNSGHFLVVGRLPTDASQAQLLINNFMQDTLMDNIDKLITLENQVINCNVQTEDKKNIYYTTLKGKSQISKSSLAVVIFKDGQHKLYAPLKKAIAPLGLVQYMSPHPGNPTTHAKTDLEQELEDKTRADSLRQVAAAQASIAMTDSLNALKRKDSADAANAMKSKPVGIQAGSKGTVSGDLDSSARTKQHMEQLGDVSFEEYEKKALDKTEDLKKYLVILCNKSVDWVEANKAIDQSVALFVNEDALVETSTSNNGSVYRYKIREYLKRIKLIQYDKVDIEWANVHYVSKLRKGPDGNYYGIITFEQTFRGYVDNKLMYSDITRKNVEIVLKTYNRNVEGKSAPTWDVFLSQIKVQSTKTS